MNELNPVISGKKVLLIDDNDTYRKAVKLALEVTGFTVFEAGDGQQGLSLIRNNPPDLVICDIHMPVMDGAQMLAEMKKDPQIAKIPIVMITNVQEEIENSVKVGAVEALLKSSLTPRQVVDVCIKHLAEPAETV